MKSPRCSHVYTLDSLPLPNKTVARDLGVTVSIDMKFRQHVTETVTSSMMLINTIFRSFIVREPEVYIRLYKSLVLPKLTYCSPVYFPQERVHLSALENVQKRFLKRLRWRCNLGGDFEFPAIETIFKNNDQRFLICLCRAKLLDRTSTSRTMISETSSALRPNQWPIRRLSTTYTLGGS